MPRTGRSRTNRSSTSTGNIPPGNVTPDNVSIGYNSRSGMATITGLVSRSDIPRALEAFGSSSTTRATTTAATPQRRRRRMSAAHKQALKQAALNRQATTGKAPQKAKTMSAGG